MNIRTICFYQHRFVRSNKKEFKIEKLYILAPGLCSIITSIDSAGSFLLNIKPLMRLL
jgi:hypothetical protein